MNDVPKHIQRRRRIFIGITIFIIPLVIGLLSVLVADIDYMVGRGSDTVLISLSSAIFGILVIFYTLIQTDEKRNNEFMAMCTVCVGILFILGMTTGVMILINDDFHFVMELMIFFNITSVLSTVFVIIYYLLIFRVWHSISKDE